MGITRGDPLVLIVSFCEHGSLLTLLRRRAKEKSPLGLEIKITLGLDVARGMQHLASLRFIHRDLAARNVLVATGIVGQVADFGLSRGTALKPQNEDGSDGDEGESGGGDYYRSQAGVFPVRWTAPEAMQTLKFSIASDVWSFAITLIEIFQNGDQPYKDLENAAVMQKVIGGHQHQQPAGMPAALYELAQECWALNPEERAGFDRLVSVLDFNAHKFAGGANLDSATRVSMHKTVTNANGVAETNVDAVIADNEYADFGFGNPSESGGNVEAAADHAEVDAGYEMPDGFNGDGARQGMATAVSKNSDANNNNDNPTLARNSSNHGNDNIDVGNTGHDYVFAGASSDHGAGGSNPPATLSEYSLANGGIETSADEPVGWL